MGVGEVHDPAVRPANPSTPAPAALPQQRAIKPIAMLNTLMLKLQMVDGHLAAVECSVQRASSSKSVMKNVRKTLGDFFFFRHFLNIFSVAEREIFLECSRKRLTMVFANESCFQ